MNIRSIIFACIVGMAAIAATHEIDQEASYTEATAFVQSFLGEEMHDGSGMQKKKESACLKVATDAIKVVRDICAKQRKVINKLAKGKLLCCSRGRTAWCKAKTRHAASKATGEICKNQLKNVKKTGVNFGIVKFENLKPGKCGTFFKSSAYKNVKNKVDKKKRACEKNKGATVAFAAGVRSARGGAATSRRNCHSADKKSYNTAYRNAKNICESKENKKMFTRAKHMLCVLNGQKMSKCNVGKIPSLPKTRYMNAKCSAGIKTQCLNPKIKNMRNRYGISSCKSSARGECWYKSTNSNGWNGKVVSSLDVSLGEGIKYKVMGSAFGGASKDLMVGLASKKNRVRDNSYTSIDYAFFQTGPKTLVYESGSYQWCNVNGKHCNRYGTRGMQAGTYSIVRCYDGTIRYYSNGKLVRKVPRSTIPLNEKAAVSASLSSYRSGFMNLVKINAEC